MSNYDVQKLQDAVRSHIHRTKSELEKENFERMDLLELLLDNDVVILSALAGLLELAKRPV